MPLQALLARYHVRQVAIQPTQEQQHQEERRDGESQIQPARAEELLAWRQDWGRLSPALEA